jgi:hypothetical protein
MLSRAHVGDIGDPFGVGGCRTEVSLQMILGSTRTSACGLLMPLPPLRHAVQSGPAHQARHAVAATRLAGKPQIFPHTRASHDAIMVGMQRTNPCE